MSLRRVGAFYVFGVRGKKEIIVNCGHERTLSTEPSTMSGECYHKNMEKYL